MQLKVKRCRVPEECFLDVCSPFHVSVCPCVDAHSHSHSHSHTYRLLVVLVQVLKAQHRCRELEARVGEMQQEAVAVARTRCTQEKKCASVCMCIAHYMTISMQQTHTCTIDIILLGEFLGEGTHLPLRPFSLHPATPLLVVMLLSVVFFVFFPLCQASERLAEATKQLAEEKEVSSSLGKEHISKLFAFHLANGSLAYLEESGPSVFRTVHQPT